jgi:acetate kinase
LRSYCYQIKKLIGSYAAAMGGLDAIAFAGGIGENSATVRRLACQNLTFLGVELDEQKNKNAAIGSEISAKGAPVRIFVTGTNEELIVAEKAAELLVSTAGRAKK